MAREVTINVELEEALKLAYDGRALLFVGAGFSRGAKNLAGEDFSLGSDLSTILLLRLS